MRNPGFHHTDFLGHFHIRNCAGPVTASAREVLWLLLGEIIELFLEEILSKGTSLIRGNPLVKGNPLYKEILYQGINDSLSPGGEFTRVPAAAAAASAAAAKFLREVRIPSYRLP